MQSAYFCKIFLKKKLVKLELKFYRSPSLQTKSTSRYICGLWKYANRMCGEMYGCISCPDEQIPLHDRRCTYNVTLRRVPATIVVVDKE
jgi:hypothetical protein